MRSREVNVAEVDKKYEYIVAMGISTGGPKLLSELVTKLETNASATYIIVQHMPAGFTKNLAERLNERSKLWIKEAEHGEVLKRGVVYIAPGGKQLKIAGGVFPQFELTDEPSYKGHRPSVNVMLNSLANLNSCYKKYIAVIMTGMGSDGLEGVTHLKLQKRCKVIAQDEATSVVFGMPKAIVKEGLADYIVPSTEITKTIKMIMGDNDGS